MKAILIYDISSDRVRNKVADACLDYALQRIQYSAFFGDISGNHLEELLQRIRRLAGREQIHVEIFPICEKDLRLRRTLTQTRLAPPPGSLPRAGAAGRRGTGAVARPRGRGRVAAPAPSPEGAPPDAASD